MAVVEGETGNLRPRVEFVGNPLLDSRQWASQILRGSLILGGAAADSWESHIFRGSS